MLRLAIGLLAGSLLFGQTAIELLEHKTLARIAEFDKGHDGILGVAAIDLETGRRFAFHGDTIFAQASSIKIPIMIRVFQAWRAGELDMDEAVTMDPKEYVGGSGELQEGLKKGPVKTTVREIVKEMIRSSDNTATNWCIRKVGMAQVNRTLDELSLVNTRLRRIMLDSAAASRDEENISTPNEMATLVEMIYRQRVVDSSAALDMINLMKLVKAGFRRGVPEGVEVASKPGELTGVHCETGVIYLKNRPFVLSVMTAFNAKEESAVPAVTRIVYEHFERLARGNRYGNLGTR